MAWGSSTSSPGPAIGRYPDWSPGLALEVMDRFGIPATARASLAMYNTTDDLDALRRCRPGDCGLKLSEAEIEQLAPLARARHADGAAVQQAFRAALLSRTQQYLATGFAGAPPYRDQDEPVDLAAEFSGLLAQAGFLPQRLPQLTNFLVRYPTVPEPAAESFLYWSKEILGRRPVISITHVTLMRPDGGPDAVVVSRQVYATHYVSGSLAITATAVMPNLNRISSGSVINSARRCHDCKCTRDDNAS